MGRRRADACPAWELLLEILREERGRRPAIAAELGLSEAQCRVLEELEPEAPVSMCRLAEALDCDPSNVTGIVDRLEARRLVDRRPDAVDRRVKNLVLTAAGREQRERILRSLAEPPSSIRSLPATDRKALYEILRRALDSPRS